jgi:short-subunit dehydrogenase
MDIRGKRALVTGASRGIGEAIARELAGRGADVVLVARNAELLETVAADIGGTAHPTDLLDLAAVQALIPDVEAAGGPVDILVNNAGLDMTGAFAESDPEDLERIYRVNLLTPVQLCRAALPGMLERGRGHLVNISSMSGAAGYPGLVAYASTKAGLTHFTGVLDLELRGLPVQTTVVELGPIPTDMLEHVQEYRPTRQAFDRAYKIHLLVDIPREKVATAVAAAIKKERSTVRLPKRAMAFPMATNFPRNFVRVLNTGLDHQP